MTNKSTKKALLLSVLSMLMCVAMLVGTTFAWFTDSVTSGKNTITAGNLDIELEYTEDPTDADSWKTVAGATDLLDPKALWEPGHVEVVYLKISNLGTLALKYQLSMNIWKETVGKSVLENDIYLSDHLLYGVVDYTAPFATREDAITAVEDDAVALENYVADGEMLKGDTKVVALVVYMPTTVGNEANYRGEIIPAIELGVNLVATQLTSEKDFFNNQYDEDAGYTVFVKDEAGLAAALKFGGKIVVDEDITVNETIIVPEGVTVVLDLNGKTISNASGNVIKNYGTLTVMDSSASVAAYSLRGSVGGTVKSDATYAINNSGTLIVENVAISGIFNAGVATLENVIVNNVISGRHAIYHSGSALTVNGGTYTSTSGNELINAPGSNVVLNDGTFTMIGKSYLFGPANAGIVINDGVYNGYVNADGSNDKMRPGAAVVNGGTFNFDVAAWVAEGYESADNGDGTYIVKEGPVAKVGNNSYYTIDEAVAAWTANSTLTLTKDVTLSDVITIKSTEHHILNLGKYTMTAAEGKNAIEIIACGTGSGERNAITVKADAANPGGINAGTKSVVYYDYSKGGITGDDRPIIKIEGGVFTGSTSSWGTAGIYTKGTAARKCATLNISGGTFNCSILGTSKSKALISGGTFNYSVSSQGDSTCYRLISGGTFKTLGFMTADSQNTKFWFGTSMGNSNVGVYVDDNGYLVVGGPVITEAGDKFVASSTNYGGWSSYLKYSSAAANGLYYTSLKEACANNNKATGVVAIHTDKVDMTDISYKGTFNINDTLTVAFAEGTTPTWTVASAVEGKTVTSTDVVADGVVTRTYTLSASEVIE